MCLMIPQRKHHKFVYQLIPCICHCPFGALDSRVHLQLHDTIDSIRTHRVALPYLLGRRSPGCLNRIQNPMIIHKGSLYDAWRAPSADGAGTHGPAGIHRVAGRGPKPPVARPPLPPAHEPTPKHRVGRSRSVVRSWIHLPVGLDISAGRDRAVAR